MAEPDWTDVDAVRDWLGSRYPNANSQTGSPFLQYLKDERTKGNKIRGREKHLSRGRGGEFIKWLGHFSEGTFLRNSADNLRVTYYPEYIDPLSPSTSPSPDRINARRGSEIRASPSTLERDPSTSRRSGKQANPKPSRKKPASKGNGAGPSDPRPEDAILIKQPEVETLPSTSRRKARKRADTNMVVLHRQRMITLRPRRERKRPRTGRIRQHN